MNTYAPAHILQDVWPEVLNLRLRLRSQIKLTRHVYRGDVCYIFQDTASDSFYRFSPEVYAFIALMDGTSTLGEINASRSADPQEQLTPEKIVEILVQLYAVDAIASRLPAQIETQLQAAQQKTEPAATPRIGLNLLFFRIPLVDPESFLVKYKHFSEIFFTRSFLWLFVALITFAAIQLVLNWQAFTHNIFDNLFARNNLFLLWLIYPVIKTIHELAHTFAIKKWGGEVHELGIMFLLLMPVPYVNASAATVFVDKWQRIVVSAAGIIAELTLAAAALLLWPHIEAGLLRTICHNIILIGGFSTLIFNGNPLVRFDGYYILADILEIPNLASRSQAYLWYLFERYLLTIADVGPGPMSSGERKWFIFYGLASFAYRVVLYASIFLILVNFFEIAGIAFGLLSIFQLFIAPFVRRMRKLLTHPGYKPYRTRIRTAAALMIVGPVFGLLAIPLPYSTEVEGVLWPPDDAIVRMETPGIIETVQVSPFTGVERGRVLIESVDPELSTSIELLRSQINEYRLKSSAAFALNPLESQIIEEHLQDLEKRFQDKLNDQSQLTIRSGAAGRFIVPGNSSLAGNYRQQGDILGYILQPINRVKVLVSQQEIDTIAANTTGVELVVVNQPDKVYQATIMTKNPQVTQRLPHKALGTAGGGSILVDPSDGAGLKMLEDMFLLEVKIDSSLENTFIGSRVFVQFQHGNEPLIFRYVKKIQQLFLNILHP
jgi:putative peptide zinc metalloprotease protein